MPTMQEMQKMQACKQAGSWADKVRQESYKEGEEREAELKQARLS